MTITHETECIVHLHLGPDRDPFYLTTLHEALQSSSNAMNVSKDRLELAKNAIHMK